jgi:curved DNA-binding protein
MEFKDYYKALGVAKTASAKEIKQAFRKLARKVHPDVNPDDTSAEGRFKDLNEAYEVLGDPEKRKKYDELGANWRMYEQAGAAGGRAGAGPNPTGAWNVHMGGGPGGGFRTMSPEDVEAMFGDADPFSDFFHTFFGGAEPPGSDEPRRARGGGRSRARQGRDVEQEIALGLEDASRGSMRRLQISHGGEARTVDVRIPPGVGDGSRVRVAGEGEHGAGGAKSGDLYLRIRLQPHPRFELRGKDLYTRVSVPLTVAVLGGEVDVDTLAGKALRLKIPPTTQNGQVLRLKGHGMPTAGKPATVGDLYVTVAVQLPRQLTAEQREHFEALARLDTMGATP